MSHPAPSFAELLVSKVRTRLVLPCALFLFLSSIDRANISFAALRMNRDLGLSPTAYGFGAGIFFVGYLAAQFPSVMLLEKIGMRRWLASVALLWGLAATGMAFIESAKQFYALRLLLGVAEAGLAAGIMLYLGRWGDERSRASMIAIPLAAIPLSLVIGGPVSGLLMESSNAFGLTAWRWMFLIEGGPAIILAIAAFCYFPDKPGDARWLTDDERTWLDQHATVQDQTPDAPELPRWRILGQPRAWLAALIWFCLLAGNYGVIFWLPQVISSTSTLTPKEVGVVVALPWLANAAAILWNARRSDRSGERYFGIAIPNFVGAAVLIATIFVGASLGSLILLVILGGALGAAMAPYWALPTRLLRGGNIAVGITLINILGSTSGLIVPVVIGAIHQRLHSFTIPMLILALIMACGGILALFARTLDDNPNAAGPDR